MAVHGLNKIFDIDILGNPDKFINEDSTINMPKILRDCSGSNVDSSELPYLSADVSTLMSNGLISNADYFILISMDCNKTTSIKSKDELYKK